MAFNGSGVHDWTQDLTKTVPVTASRMDAEHDDISSSLSAVICRDGQSTTTARIPFASGVSAAAGTMASVAYAQTNDANTGMYFPATDQWGLVAGGTAVLAGTSSGVTVTGTFNASGAATLSSSLALTGDLAINTNKLTVAAASGNTAIAGMASITGDVAVNTNKFNVTAASGNTTVAGTLGVAGAAIFSAAVTISSGGAAISGSSTVTGTLGVSSDLAINTNKFNVVGSNGNTTIAGTLAVAGLMTGRIPLLHVRDEKAAGTAGGTFTSGSFQTRTLNTEVTNEIAGASLLGNQIILPAGTYEIDAHAPGYNTGLQKLKLRNVTDGSDALIGSSEDGASSGNQQMRAFLKGRITLGAQKTFELQHRCETTSNTNGLGRAANFGVVEVYAEVLIWKVA